MKIQLIILLLSLISCSQLNVADQKGGKELWQKLELLLKPNGDSNKVKEFFGTPNEVVTKEKATYWFYYQEKTSEQKFSFKLDDKNGLTSFVYIPRSDSYPEFELEQILEYLKNDNCRDSTIEKQETKGHSVSVQRKISCRGQKITLNLNKYREIEFIDFNLLPDSK